MLAGLPPSLAALVQLPWGTSATALLNVRPPDVGAAGAFAHPPHQVLEPAHLQGLDPLQSPDAPVADESKLCSGLNRLPGFLRRRIAKGILAEISPAHICPDEAAWAAGVSRRREKFFSQSLPSRGIPPLYGKARRGVEEGGMTGEKASWVEDSRDCGASLRRFLLSKMGPEEILVLASHVQDCFQCRDYLQSLASLLQRRREISFQLRKEEENAR